MLDQILITLIAFGIWTSYTDIKTGKIKNYSILLLLLAAVFLNIFYTKSFLTHPLLSTINISIAIVGSVLIWLCGLWSAADSKLFIAFTALIPVTLYKPIISYFPGISILANSVIPLFIFSFFYVIFKTSIKEKKETIINLVKPRFMIQTFLAILALMSISNVISHVFNISLNYFLTITMLFAVMWLVEQKLKFKLSYFFLAAISLSAIFFHELIFTMSFFLNWIIFSCLIIFIFFLINLSRFVYTKPIRLTELKMGMIPAEMILKRREKYFKKSISFITPLIMLRERSIDKPLFGYNPDGIINKDIEKVLKLYKEKKLPFDEIRICKTVHFAPFIFLGVLLTYFAKGYFIYLFI